MTFAGSSLARPRPAFEAVAGFYKLPPHDELVRLLIKQHPTRAATFSRRHFFLQAFIGSRSKPETTPSTIGFSDFLETMLGLQPADAVVVKMDVEGYEFDIVQTLLADGTHALIDEIMLEVHYGHPYMRQTYNWCRTPQFLAVLVLLHVGERHEHVPVAQRRGCLRASLAVMAFIGSFTTHPCYSSFRSEPQRPTFQEPLYL